MFEKIPSSLFISSSKDCAAKAMAHYSKTGLNTKSFGYQDNNDLIETSSTHTATERDTKGDIINGN